MLHALGGAVGPAPDGQVFTDPTALPGSSQAVSVLIGGREVAVVNTAALFGGPAGLLMIQFQVPQDQGAATAVPVAVHAGAYVSNIAPLAVK